MIKKMLNPISFFFCGFCLCVVRLLIEDVKKIITTPTIVSIILGIASGILAGFLWNKSIGQNNLNNKLRYSRLASASQLLILASLLYLPENWQAPFSALGASMLILSVYLFVLQLSIKRQVVWNDLEIVIPKINSKEIGDL